MIFFFLNGQKPRVNYSKLAKTCPVASSCQARGACSVCSCIKAQTRMLSQHVTLFVFIISLYTVK